MKSIFKRNDTIIFLTFIFVALLAIFLYNIFHGNIFNSFQASGVGTLGDAFNGLTAPFISLGSAVLIFYSFKAQRDANRLITDQWEVDRLEKQFENIKMDIRNLDYSNERGEKFAGVKAINEFRRVFSVMPAHKDNYLLLQETISILSSLSILNINLALNEISLERKELLMGNVILWHHFISENLLQIEKLIEKKSGYEKIVEGFRRYNKSFEILSQLHSGEVAIPTH